MKKNMGRVGLDPQDNLFIESGSLCACLSK